MPTAAVINLAGEKIPVKFPTDNPHATIEQLLRIALPFMTYTAPREVRVFEGSRELFDQGSAEKRKPVDDLLFIECPPRRVLKNPPVSGWRVKLGT